MRQSVGEIANDREVRIYGTEKIRVAGHHKIRAGSDRRARWKSEVDAFVQLPAGQVHGLSAAVEKFDPGLARFRVRQTAMVIHDLVDDDFAVEGKEVGIARRGLRRIKPTAGCIRMSSTQSVFDDDRVNDGTAVGWIEDKCVAGSRVKTELDFVQRQETAGNNRVAGGKNELIVERAVADKNVAIQRNIVRAAVRQFQPERSIGCRSDFIKRQRRRGRRRQQFSAKQQIIGSGQGLVHLDCQHVCAESKARRGDRVQTAPGVIGRLDRSGRGECDRAIGQVHAQDFDPVQVKHRSVIHQRMQP